MKTSIRGPISRFRISSVERPIDLDPQRRRFPRALGRTLIGVDRHGHGDLRVLAQRNQQLDERSGQHLGVERGAGPRRPGSHDEQVDHLGIDGVEGGRPAVNALYNKIVRDERHRDIALLHYQEVAERKFAGWTMGQVNLAKINPSLLLKYFRRVELDPFDCSGQSTLALLAELVDTASILSRSE